VAAFVLIVDIRIKPENIDTFMAAILASGKATRETEPGCLTFDILVDPEERAHINLYEVYASEAAFQAHQQTPHFKNYLANAVPLLAHRERHVWTRAAP
jgi:(4S)-4-hydroxy-5-phosphonooxypentane-2,3-dione isomerase